MGTGRQIKACQESGIALTFARTGVTWRLKDRGAGAPNTANQVFAITSFGEDPAPTENSD